LSESFPTRFLKAADLQNREVKAVIENVKLEQMNDGKEDYKPVLTFVGKKKGLTLNKTNGEKLAASFGDETAEWAGKEVILYPDKTQYNGQLVDCIRVRVPVAAATEGGEEPPF
jgi:hypothetical protein